MLCHISMYLEISGIFFVNIKLQDLMMSMNQIHYLFENRIETPIAQDLCLP